MTRPASLALVCLLSLGCDPVAGGNIVHTVASSPGVTNGLVGGEPTEFNLLLTATGVEDEFSLDPTAFGHQIPAGGRLELELGGTYERNGVDNGQPPVTIDSNRYFVMTAGPQNPISEVDGVGVQHANYTIVDSGGHLLTVVPNGGSGANGLEGERAAAVGVKVLHVRPVPYTNVGPSAFTNGPAGSVGTIDVRIYDADGALVESGHGEIIFPAAVGRQVHVSNFGLTTPRPADPSVSSELHEHTNFQHVSPSAMLENETATTPFSAGFPYAPSFLVFDDLADQPDSFTPHAGIAGMGYVVLASDERRAMLIVDTSGDGLPGEDDEVIGTIELTGPSMGRILPRATLTTSTDGTDNPNGSAFHVPVQVGSASGTYRLTVAFTDGGQATNVIYVD